MRTVKVQGGLGNQLFGVGLAHRVAEITREPVDLDVASYGADRYGHGFDLAPLAERLGMPLTRRPLLSSRAATAAMRPIRRGSYVSEAAPPKDREALDDVVRRGRYFNGYWQDERYLSESFRGTARSYLLDRAGVGPSIGVVIHLRTYKEEVRSERRSIPDRDWFARCLDRLDDPGDIVLISDDPAVALAHIGDIGRPVRAVTGGALWSDMALMLRAKALILTNSSYSWWGGWCAEASQIFYPARGGLFHYPTPAGRFTVMA